MDIPTGSQQRATVSVRAGKPVEPFYFESALRHSVLRLFYHQ